MTDTAIDLELTTIYRMLAVGWAEKVDGKWRTTDAFDAHMETIE